MCEHESDIRQKKSNSEKIMRHMEIVKRPFLPPSGVMGNIYISSKKKATNESSRDRQNDFCNSVSVLLHLHFLHVCKTFAKRAKSVHRITPCITNAIHHHCICIFCSMGKNVLNAL